MRLIDGDALKNKMQEQQKYGSVADSRGRAKAIVEVIHAPTVEAEPVKHGRWIYSGIVKNDDVYNCSQCDSNFVFRDRLLYDYCPDCGARMDGDNDD